MRGFGVGLGFCLVLAGCGGVDLSPLPLLSVSTDGVVMRGTLSLQKDFTGTVALNADGSDLSCRGLLGADGAGILRCTDGQDIPIAIPRPPYGETSGSIIQKYPERRVAYGWGAEANPARLGALLGP